MKTDERESRRRTKILNTVVFSTKFVVEDICNADERFRKKISAMSNSEIRTLIKENLKTWENGFSKGIMFDWDVVAQEVADNTEFPEREEE